MKKHYSLHEAALLLGLHRKTVAEKIRLGIIKGKRKKVQTFVWVIDGKSLKKLKKDLV